MTLFGSIFATEPFLALRVVGLLRAFLLRVAAAFLAALERALAFLLRVAAAFLAAADLLAAVERVDFLVAVFLRAFLLRVAAAFLAAAERFAAFLFLVAAAFFAAADLLAAVEPLRAVVFLVGDLRVRFAGILFTFFDFGGGFTRTSLCRFSPIEPCWLLFSI